MKMNAVKRTITSSRGNTYRIPKGFKIAKVRVVKQTMPSYKDFMNKLRVQLAKQYNITFTDMKDLQNSLLLFSNQFHLETTEIADTGSHCSYCESAVLDNGECPAGCNVIHDNHIYIECVLCLAHSVVAPKSNDKADMDELAELTIKLNKLKHPKKSKFFARYIELCKKHGLNREVA